MTGRARAALAVSLLVLGAGCRRPRQEEVTVSRQADAAALAERREPPAVEYAGCARVEAGPVCRTHGAASITLWMSSSVRELELTLDGRALQLEDEVSAGGYRVTVPAASGLLELRRPGGAPFQLRLEPDESSSLLAAAEAAKNAGDFASALRQAAELPSAPALDGWRADGLRARVYLQQGRLEEARALLERSAPALFAAGQLSDATRDVFTLFYLLLERQFRSQEASAWLERWREGVASYPLGRALLDEHLGMLADRGGERAVALRSFWRARRRYEQLGQALDAARAEERELLLLAELGLTHEAWERHARVRAASGGASQCDRAHITALQAWFAMLEVQAGNATLASSVGELLEQAEHDERRCGDPELRVTGLVNRGLWALETEQWAQARRVRSELGQLPARAMPHLGAWLAEFEGRLALAERRLARARRQFEHEAALGRSAGLLDPELRALLGLAEVETAAGQGRAAEARLREALGVLARARRQAPFNRLARAQFSTRQGAAQRLIELLLRRGEVREAHRLAFSSYSSLLARAPLDRLEALPAAQREHYRRVLGEYELQRRALDQAALDDWQLSRAELSIARARRRDQLFELERSLDELGALLPSRDRDEPPPPAAPGEVRILIFPLRGSWAVFAQAGDELSARLANAPAAELPWPSLLEPFAAQLARADRIVLLPGGVSWQWPFERWLHAGAPAARWRLAFSAGLAPFTAALPSPPRAPAVAADPRGDLPFARHEGLLVQRTLRVPAERTIIGPRLTSSGLAALFASADFLHFAGHARGPGNGEPALLLARDDELALWELASLRSVPRWVVLSACDSGVVSGMRDGLGWGLAQVLVGLGAEAVIAPLNAIRDADAYVFQQRFYAELAGGAAFHDAFWRTQDALAEREGGRLGLRLFIR